MAKAKMGRPLEWTEERIRIEADALIEWASDSSAINFEAFTCYRDERYVRAHLFHMSTMSDYFSKAFTCAREMVRKNREMAVATGKMHQAVYAKTCTFYDREKPNINESLAGHIKDMDRAKRDAKKDDTVDALKAANDAIQGLNDAK